MNLDEWIDELDFRINASVMDNAEWVKLHIDDLIDLNNAIQEFLNGDGDS